MVLLGWQFSGKKNNDMTMLESKLNSRSDDFKANAAAMQIIVDDLKEKVAKIALGGGDDARKKHTCLLYTSPSPRDS